MIYKVTTMFFKNVNVRELNVNLIENNNLRLEFTYDSR